MQLQRSVSAYLLIGSGSNLGIVVFFLIQFKSYPDRGQREYNPVHPPAW